MRTVVLVALLVAPLADCGVRDVDLGFLPSPATTPPAPCTAAPSALSTIPNVLAAPFLMDDGYVYVVSTATPGDLTNETLWQIAKTTDGHTVAVATNQHEIGGIDVKETSSTDPEGAVLWTTGSTGEDAGASGAIWKRSGNGPAAVLIGDRPSPGALFTYGERIYWAEQGGVMWAVASGGAVSMLQLLGADQVPRAFSLAGNNLVWTTADPALANQAAAVVVAAPIPLPFGLTTELAGPDGGGVGAIETQGYYDGRVIYSGPTGIMNVVPPASPTQIVGLSGFVERIVDDDTALYFIDPGTGDIMASAESGDAGATRVVTGPFDPALSFGVDEACVYWIDTTLQTVTTVRK